MKYHAVGAVILASLACGACGAQSGPLDAGVDAGIDAPAVFWDAGCAFDGCDAGMDASTDAGADAWISMPYDGSVPACAEEYYDGIVTFPDGTTHAACSLSGDEGIVVHWDPLAWCDEGIGGAGGISASGSDVSWSVGPGWERIDPLYRGAWYSPTGPVTLTVRYAPTSAPPSECLPGLPLSCDFTAHGCAFELTRAAVADGEIIQGHMLAPCEMRSTDDYTNPWQPTLTSFRFRTHLSGLDHDAGPCVPFP